MDQRLRRLLEGNRTCYARREIFRVWPTATNLQASCGSPVGDGADANCCPRDPKRKWRLFTMSATAAGNDAAVCSRRRSLHDIQCSAKHHLNCDVENDGQTNISNPSMILQKARNEGSGHAHHRNRKP